MQAFARIFVSLGLNKKDSAVRKGESDGYICTHIRFAYKLAFDAQIILLL
jgi:hypothetical protein